MNKLKTYKFYVNWVLKNEIAIGPAPTTKDDLLKLKENNIKGILSLCSSIEVKPPENIKNTFFCERIILPDHSYTRTLNIKELNKALKILEEMKKKGSIFVHCKAAIERSPIVCMAWLIKKHGLTMPQALDYLMTVNKGTCPLKSQLLILNELN